MGHRGGYSYRLSKDPFDPPPGDPSPIHAIPTELPVGYLTPPRVTPPPFHRIPTSPPRGFLQPAHRSPQCACHARETARACHARETPRDQMLASRNLPELCCLFFIVNKGYIFLLLTKPLYFIIFDQNPKGVPLRKYSKPWFLVNIQREYPYENAQKPWFLIKFQRGIPLRALASPRRLTSLPVRPMPLP